MNSIRCHRYQYIAALLQAIPGFQAYCQDRYCHQLSQGTIQYGPAGPQANSAASPLAFRLFASTPICICVASGA